MKKIIYFLLIYTFNLQLSAADIIEPNSNIEPFQVIKIQLKSLQKNNSPSIDNGIEQTWEFAHPNNKKNTGPLDRFKSMLKSKSYKVLLDHLDHEIIQEYITDSVASFEVRVLGKDKSYYKYVGYNRLCIAYGIVLQTEHNINKYLQDSFQPKAFFGFLFW